MPSLIQQVIKITRDPQRVYDALGEQGRVVLPFLWEALAREEQRPPDATWWDTWLYMAGRGGGKTRAGAEWIRKKVKEGCRRIALVAPTAADARDIMIEGESGILSVCPYWDRDNKGRLTGYPYYEPSKRRLTWANGARAYAYSAEKPGRLRGPQHDAAWADELAIWPYMQEAYDMLMLGLRLGEDPQLCITTTPRPLKLIRELLKDDNIYVTRGTSYNNKENLADSWYKKIIKRYEGTRLGRQELDGELLDDNPDSLWTRNSIDENRVREAPEDLLSVVVAIDPAATSNEDSADTGIVVAAEGSDEHYYILDDKTCHESPSGWAKKAILAYDYWLADKIIGEVNHGGEMIEAVIRGIIWPNNDHTRGDDISYEAVRASRGKAIRAEPISMLYEQGRVHHVGVFPELEDQLCQWSPNLNEKSPDRLDALVWAITSLMEGGAPTVRSLG